MQIILGLLGIGSLEVDGESQTKVTFKGKTISVSDILTEVNVMDVITCYAPDSPGWRSPDNCNKKFTSDYNIQVTTDNMNKTVVTLTFLEFVENGVFTCGGCHHSVPFAIYKPDSTTRNALLAAAIVLATFFSIILCVALYAIRGKLRSEDALQEQQREVGQARRDTA
eukprot:scpid106323/ scgid2670/ 